MVARFLRFGLGPQRLGAASVGHCHASRFGTKRLNVGRCHASRFRTGRGGPRFGTQLDALDSRPVLTLLGGLRKE